MKKLVIYALTAAMLFGTTACTGKAKNSSLDADLTSYPIETDASLTYWLPLDSNLTSSVTNFGETEYAKELEKRTGVSVSYIHPAAGQQSEALSIMIASDELTDLIQSDWVSGYLGGPSKAISDGVILSLNDYMKNYAPGLSKVLKENPSADRDVKTDEGDYYVFPMLKLDDRLRSTIGLVLRADWLKDLNLEVPKTVDEWETVLRAFKNEKGATAPMSFNYSNMYVFVNMFGADYGNYMDGDTVKYGPLEPAFKEALATMHSWYEEGLLDKNIASVDASMIDANILNNKTGASIVMGGSGLGKYLEYNTDDGFDLVAAPAPGKVKGEKSDFYYLASPYTRGGSVAVSAACKTPELAVKYMDYLYTEEGHMLANFGTEGVSYEMKDDYPTYTELITKSPEGKSMSSVMPLYFRSSTTGPFVQDVRYIEQYYAKPQQKNAISTWSQKAEDSTIETVPAITPTSEESEEYANLMASISKYTKEMMIKFITGVEPLDNYDAFVARLKELKIDRALEIQQTAYNRYLKR